MPVPDFSRLLQPVPRTAVLQDDDWYLWGGSMVRTDDGVCHLLVSRWPRARGHNAWVTHSEIAYATATEPLGPYTVRGVALPRRGGEFWDAEVTHNPNVVRLGQRYYLAYMGNRGNGEFWDHRNRQRIGVAWADHPAGPWRRPDRPTIDVTPGDFDGLMCSNPSLVPLPDGRCALVYKCAAEGPPPRGGKVVHTIAWADSPLGPYTRHDRPIFEHPTAAFAGEDPYVWLQNGRWLAIVKDMGGHYTPHGRALILFCSTNGTDWELAPQPLVSTLQIRWADGTTERVEHLERPQLWRDEIGRPRVLFCAADRDRGHSFNVHLPLGDG